MSAFTAAAAKHARAVDDRAGERLQLVRQAKAGRTGGGAGKAKGLPVEFRGTVTRRPVEVQRQGVGAQGATNVQLSTAKWQVSYPAERAAGLAITPDDVVVRLDPPPGEPARLKVYTPLPIRGRVIHPADEVAEP